MPNTVVKLTNAESTWLEAAREDRKLLIKEKHLQKCRCFFHAFKVISEQWSVIRARLSLAASPLTADRYPPVSQGGAAAGF